VRARREGKYEEAEKMFTKCIKTYRRSYGPDHEIVGDILCLIARLRENMGKDDEAIEVRHTAFIPRRKKPIENCRFFPAEWLVCRALASRLSRRKCSTADLDVRACALQTRRASSFRGFIKV